MGRPAFEPSPEQHLQVSQWVEAKVSIAEMARRMGKAEKTFRKAFAVELGLPPVNTGETRPAATKGEVLSPPGSVNAPPRPPFVPSLEQRELVNILAGARISDEEIARKLSMPVEQLKEHFSDELENGPARCRADVIQATFYSAKGGNVAAQKVYLLLNQQAQGDEDEKPRAASPVALGKKEQRKLDADDAGKGTDWGGDLEAPAAIAGGTKH